MKSNFLQRITVMALLAFPAISFGQAPDLGSASSFALFTAAGAFDNTGTTAITGNIGSATYAPTGFPPGTVSGTIYASGDALSALAATDVATAYAYMSTLTGSVIGITMVDQTLHPGIYTTGGAATLNGTLTFDGDGDPNALFIIRIGGAFATGSNVVINLINGASICNIYWQIAGQFDLGTNSMFAGTVLAMGAINLTDGSVLLGRGLSTAGAISTQNSRVVFEPGPAGAISGASSVCQGETGLVYSVPAIENATTYLWTLPPGALITAGDNTNSITVSYGPSASSGNVTVQGSSSCGTGAVSADFPVTVNPTPVVVDQTATIVSGETFTVTPLGVPVGTTYTWTAPSYTGGVTGGSAQALPQTSISGLLTIPSGDGTAIYTVTPSSGTCVGTPFFVTVSVSAACTPVGILTQPVDNALCEDIGNASFTVVPSGTGPFTYQWQYDNGGSWENVVNDSPLGAIYLGSTEATLNVAGLSTAGSYQYHSVLTNCAGVNSLTSATVTLTVNPVPSITDQTEAIISGETFTVTPLGAPVGTTYTWTAPSYTGGVTGGSAQALPQASISGLLTIPSGVGTAIYTVTPSSGPCTGSPFLVTVTVSTACTPVSIVLQPISSVICEDTGNASFAVVASGTGPFTYQWQYDNGGSWENVVNDSPLGAIYLGSTEATLNVAGISTAGSYQYHSVLTNCAGANNVTSATATLLVNAATEPPVFITGATTLCQNAADETYTATAANSTSITYAVTPASAGVINALTGVMNWEAAFSGTATVTATAVGLCGTTTTDRVVTVNPFPSAAGLITGPETVCQTATGAVYTVPAILNATSYLWTVPSGAIITAGATTNTITVTFGANAVSGNFTVQGSNGCGTGTLSDTFFVEVNITPNAVAGSNSPVCEGSPIYLTAETVVDGRYSWTGPNNFTSAAQNPIIPAAIPANAGVYTLITSTTCNCCFSEPSSVTVVVNNCYVADLQVVTTADNLHPFIGRTVVFTIVASNLGPDQATGVLVSNLLQSGFTYVSSTSTAGTYNPATGDWIIGGLNHGESEQLTLTATVLPTGNFTHTATISGIEADGNLANNTATVTTFPTDFFIPEGFSPNDDGINDAFVIRGLENYADNTLIIYNRWGNKVFEASPYLNNWDGTSAMGLRVGGSKLPTGTYFYLLDLGNGSDILKGSIYLNR